MIRMFFIIFFSSASLFSFESTNLQLLYSNNFKGDAFIYDTKDGEKTTLTFEHFRTFDLGDFFMFVDITDGEMFDGVENTLYSELAPRFSLSKISNSKLSYGPIEDFYLAGQLNVGNDFKAYLGGVGIDISVPAFVFVNLNLYYKSDNINAKDTYQISSAYKSISYYGIHFEGFIDITARDINTQNQLLYNLAQLFKTKEQFFIGTEWLFYDLRDEGQNAHTNVFQAMLKYQF